MEFINLPNEIWRLWEKPEADRSIKNYQWRKFSAKNFLASDISQEKKYVFMNDDKGSMFVPSHGFIEVMWNASKDANTAFTTANLASLNGSAASLFRTLLIEFGQTKVEESSNVARKAQIMSYLNMSDDYNERNAFQYARDTDCSGAGNVEMATGTLAATANTSSGAITFSSGIGVARENLSYNRGLWRRINSIIVADTDQMIHSYIPLEVISDFCQSYPYFVTGTSFKIELGTNSPNEIIQVLAHSVISNTTAVGSPYVWIDDIQLWMPTCEPTVPLSSEILDNIKKQIPAFIPYVKRELSDCGNPIANTTSLFKYSWTPRGKKPTKCILLLQRDDAVGNPYHNPHNYGLGGTMTCVTTNSGDSDKYTTTGAYANPYNAINGYLTCNLKLNGKKVQDDDFRFGTGTKKDYARVYEAYCRMAGAEPYIGKMPAISYDEFYKHFSAFCFDLSTLTETIEGITTSWQFEADFSAGGNASANFRIWALVEMEETITVNPAEGNMVILSSY